MFIEQVIEVELRGPGSPGRTCTPITGNFIKGNILSGLLFTAKILQKACVLLPPIWTKSLTIKILHHNARF